MNISFYIAKRYLLAKSSNNTVNIITLIASVGVIVGTLALFIILSGFSGFRSFTSSMLNTSDPDIKITATKGKSFFYTDSITQILDENKAIEATAKIIEERVFLQYKQRDYIAYIKGVSNNYTQVTNIDSTLNAGQWLDVDFPNTAVIGFGISNKLSLGISNFGEPLNIKVPKPGEHYISNIATAFKEANVQIVGVYNGLEEFANKYVFVDINLAKKLLSFKPNQLTSLELKLKPNSKPDRVADQLQEKLGTAYTVQTRIQFNSLTYKVLNTESFISYLVFTLIIIIALFNVIGAIIMMIIDKKDNLKTLFNLGVPIREIKKIFVFQGFLLTLFGLICGLSLGVFLVFLQKQFSFFMITDSIPYPVEFRLINLVVVSITISLLGFLAAKIASSRISNDFIEGG